MASAPVIRAGPFGSVVDPSDPGTSKPTRLIDAVNVYVPDPVRGSAVLQRHGFVAIVQQLGASDVARRGQGMHEHTRADGTIDRYTFGGGRMYEWDGATTFTDVTPAGIILHDRNPVFAVTFNEKVVVSDEQNKPWVFDPVAGTAVTIKYNTIDEEWTTKGGPVVYSGRVFFIVKSAGSSELIEETAPFDLLGTEDDVVLVTEALAGIRNTIAWSAPLDATLGYDQDDYDNLWTLTQSSSNLLSCLFADEAALTYVRTRGIGYITGQVEEDFRTSATTDAIAGTVGTDAPAAVVVVDTGDQTGRRAWFVDLDGRVHRMAPTGRAEQLWLAMRRVVSAQVGTAQCRDNVAQFARAGYHAGLGVVLFTIWDESTLYAFDAKSGLYLGTWAIDAGDVHLTALGTLVDASGRAAFVAIGSSGYVDDDGTIGAMHTHGTVWRQKFPDEVAPWRDTFHPDVSDQPVPFERAVETHWLAHAGSRTFRALEVVASVVGHTLAQKFGLAYTVPASGRRTDPLVALSSIVRRVLPGEQALATVNWALGRNAQGGAIRLRISGEEFDTATYRNDVQFGVHDIEVAVQTTTARRNAI